MSNEERLAKPVLSAQHRLRGNAKTQRPKAVMDQTATTVSRYGETYRAWQDNSERFWLEAAAALDWFETPSRAFDPEEGVYGRWFTDGVCNMA